MFIGIALQGNQYRVAIRSTQQSIKNEAKLISFPTSPAGIAALVNCIDGWHTPARLAVLASGAAALGIALLLGASPGHEVVLVSHATASDPVALARYAEKSI
jgi:hypothetical protein